MNKRDSSGIAFVWLLIILLGLFFWLSRASFYPQSP